jgi:para-aminobenzoate synthetase component 1
MRFSYKGKGYPLFLALHQLNPTSYAAFLQVEGQTILSLSPEMLVRKEKTKLVTAPIKGTSRDLNLLRASEKEKAELLMITDLLRHDLGLVALPATVKVEKLLEESAYYSLFHTSSTISCTVDPRYSPVQLLEQLFPGGSITGCPKIAAKQWIARLEGRKRGIYTGSIGHFLSSGDFIFNIAIRTLLLKEGEGRLALGAGIVSDSVPSAEFNETLLKGAPFFKLLGLNDLI